MRSWGRQEVLAQLWALMVKAIRTDPGSRSADQAHVVTWLAADDEPQGRGAGAQRRLGVPQVGGSGVQPPTRAPPLRRSSATCRGLPTARASRSATCSAPPRTATAATATTCRRPALEHQYDGNASRPANSAGPWCFPPYQCQDPLGCDTNQPLFESFLSWGEAGATGNWQADAPGDPQADDDFRRVAKAVSKELIYASAGSWLRDRDGPSGQPGSSPHRVGGSLCRRLLREAGGLGGRHGCRDGQSCSSGRDGDSAEVGAAATAAEAAAASAVSGVGRCRLRHRHRRDLHRGGQGHRRGAAGQHCRASCATSWPTRSPECRTSSRCSPTSPT